MAAGEVVERGRERGTEQGSKLYSYTAALRCRCSYAPYIEAKTRVYYPSIAQLEERKTVMDNVHLDVAGSIPARRIPSLLPYFLFTISARYLNVII